MLKTILFSLLVVFSTNALSQTEFKILFNVFSKSNEFDQKKTDPEPLPKEFRDDFDGASLDSERWKTIGENNGSISVNNSELTISNTGAEDDWISLVSKTDVPNGYKIRVRSKHLSGRHANLIGFAPPPYSGTPRWLSYTGYTVYSRADDSSLFYNDGYDENQNTTINENTFDASTYNVYEIHRVNSTTLKTYRNGNLLKEETSLVFNEDYPTFITADDYNTPNTVVIDWIEVSKIE